MLCVVQAQSTGFQSTLDMHSRAQGPGPGHVVLYTLKEALSWGEGSRDTKFCTSVILLPFHEVRRETVHRTQHHLLGGLPHGTM